MYHFQPETKRKLTQLEHIIYRDTGCQVPIVHFHDTESRHLLRFFCPRHFKYLTPGDTLFHLFSICDIRSTKWCGPVHQTNNQNNVLS